MKFIITLLITIFITGSSCKLYTQSSTLGEKETMKIKLSFDGGEFIANIIDNTTGKDFLSILPATLTFEDYNKTEKISYPERKLKVGNLDGYDPEVGDIAYYIPWGNLVIFYKDFGYSRSLVKIGKIEGDVSKLQDIKNNFKITIEKID